MKLLAVLAASVPLLVHAVAAHGALVGDTVVVVAKVEAELQAADGAPLAVPRGKHLVVQAVKGDLLLVEWQHRRGWIREQDVVPLELATRFFSQAIRKNRDASAEYVNRGQVFSAIGDREIAIADFNEAIRLDPQSAAAYLGRGVAWRLMGEYAKAIADCSETIRLAPASAEAYHHRGTALALQGQYDKAIADFGQSLQRDPKFAPAYCNRGNCWSDKEEYDKAIADYSEAIRLDPNASDVHLNRGTAWRLKGEYDKAIVDYTDAIQRAPKSPLAFRLRGAAWASTGGYERAITDYREATRLDPRDARAHDLLAWLLATCPDGRYRDGAKAVQHATTACELSAWNEYRRIDTLAAAYAESGNYGEAVRWQAKVLQLAPEQERDGYRARLELYQSNKPYRP